MIGWNTKIIIDTLPCLLHPGNSVSPGRINHDSGTQSHLCPQRCQESHRCRTGHQADQSKPPARDLSPHALLCSIINCIQYIVYAIYYSKLLIYMHFGVGYLYHLHSFNFVQLRFGCKKMKQ